MRVLHLIDTLGPGTSARQLEALVPLLAHEAIQLEVAVLSSSGDALRVHVPVHEIGWTRPFDPGALLQLRRVVRDFDPHVIHAWRSAALRGLALAAPGYLSRTVASAVLPKRVALPWFDRCLLARVGRLALSCESDQHVCDRAGLKTDAVVIPHATTLSKANAPPAKQRLLCAGELHLDNGYRDAIWALDILNCVYPDARLVLAGSGPHEEHLRHFARVLRKDEQVHWLRPPFDLGSLLTSAEVVWVPSRANRGRQVVLEAQAQGRLVIAADVPCLRALIRDGHDGFIVPSGDVVALARRTHVLFEDAALRERVGREAARTAAGRADLREIAGRWLQLYGDVSGQGVSLVSQARSAMIAQTPAESVLRRARPAAAAPVPLTSERGR